MADLAGRWNQKRGRRKITRPLSAHPKKHTQTHPKPHQRRDTLSLERKDVQGHSCVPFNLENVLEDPERSQKPTMVHPENFRDFIKYRKILGVLHCSFM